MRRMLAFLVLSLSLLAACGGDSPSVSDAAASELQAQVTAVRTAVGARDADGAARALETLRQSVARLRTAGGVSGERAREILSAAAAVEGELVSITTTTSTTTTTTTTVPATVPDDRGGDHGNSGKGKGNGQGKG